MTRESRSHQGARWLGQLTLLAGVACIPAASAEARVVIQVIGLQAFDNMLDAQPKAQIRLLNSSLMEPQKVHLKTVELVPLDNFEQWRPQDTDGPMDDPNGLYDLSKVKSCRGWVRLGQSEVELEPMAVEAVRVTIKVPKGSMGIYRAGIVVSVPPCRSQDGVVTAYELAIPVLLDIDEEGEPALFEPRDYALEIDPRPIRVSQDSNAKDPFRTYTGSTIVDIETTFAARILTTVIGTSPAGGIWSTSVDPNTINGIPKSRSTTRIEISVTGEDVRIDRLPGGSRPVVVAQTTIQVMPWLCDGLPLSFWQHLPRR